MDVQLDSAGAEDYDALVLPGGVLNPDQLWMNTSYPSLQTDLKNAGVLWVDKEVVTDNGLVTSRAESPMVIRLIHQGLD